MTLSSLGFSAAYALKRIVGTCNKAIAIAQHKKYPNAVLFGIVPTPFRTKNQQQRR